MAVAAYLARIDLRSRWRRYAGLVVLVALTCGLSLFALAGARRTQSSYPRYLDQVHASTVAVIAVQARTPADAGASVTDAIAHLPEVVSSRTYVGINGSVLVNGQPDASQDAEPTGTFDGRFYDQDEFTATRGRRPDPKALGEIAVNEHAADQFGYRVGDHIDFRLDDPAQLTAESFTSPTSSQPRVTMTVVGIGVFPDEVLQDEGDRSARMLFTPAFTHEYAHYVTYAVQGLILRDGEADVDAVKRSVSAIAPVESVQFRETSADTFHGLRAVRPLSIALAVFGVITGLAGMVLITQAVTRLLRERQRERVTVRAMGATSRSITVASATGPCLATVVGLVLAVTLAFLASPLMPLGPVRRLEHRHPMTFDATVLVLGGALFLLILVASTLVVAFAQRPRHLIPRARVGRRPSRAVFAAIGAGMPPTSVTGLRFAFENHPDRNSRSSTWSVMAGAALALAALVAATTFGSSLVTLVDHPALYGWSGDAVILAANGYGNIAPEQIGAILGADPAIDTWSGAYFGAGRVDGHDTPLLGMDPGAPLLPPLLRGRTIARADDIVLGPATAAALHKGVGDTVTFSGSGQPRTLTVVGIATFPSLGATHTAHPSLGVGALVAHQNVPGYDTDITGAPVGDLGPRAVFVRYRQGTNGAGEISHLKQTTAPLTGIGGLDVVPVQRPAEITSSSSVAGAPIVLAAALGLAALVSLGLALASIVRHRRRDLAILRTVGFTLTDVTASVAWLATSMIVVGLAIGVPLGIAVARVLWNAFAGQLDVIAQPDIPVRTIAGLILVAVVTANVIAVVAAQLARRLDIAEQLRPE